MIQRVALIFGIGFTLIGILGFVASGLDMTADPAAASRVLGLFPVNAVHNGVHLGFGIWGLLASRSWAGSKNFTTIGGVIYLALAGLAFIAPDGFGLVPLGSHDIWLHALAGMVMILAGSTARVPAKV